MKFREKIKEFFRGIKNPLNSGGSLIRKEKVLLFETFIVGIQYNAGFEFINSCNKGQELKLHREPGNDFDSNAIEVLTLEGIKLGYIPKVSNLMPKIIADEGVELCAEIIDLTSKINPTKFIKIAVYQLI